MLVRLSLLALLAVSALAAPFEGYESLPDNVKELLPQEAKDFFSTLTDADKAVLQDIAKNHATYENEEKVRSQLSKHGFVQVLEALKEKSPALYEKAKKLHELVKSKVDALGDEAKAFAKETIGKARAIQSDIVAGNKPDFNKLKETAKGVVEAYKALSDAAKEDLKKNFPILTNVISNEKFQKLYQQFVEKNN